ncbi:type-1 angiotensin II receptor [Pimephales promelas]|nr:type-1 angiotensin II receptor [Pimephales promelas]
MVGIQQLTKRCNQTTFRFVETKHKKCRQYTIGQRTAPTPMIWLFLWFHTWTVPPTATLCDLAYLASMGPWAVYVSSDYHWKIGRSLCIVMKILYFVGLTSSTMFICAISSDRFLAIVFPLESRMIRTPRNTALVSLLLWAITALFIYFSYPNIFYAVRKDGIHVCGAVVISKFRTSEATYNLMSYYSIQVSVPLLLIIPAYVKIISKMKQSRQQWGQGNMQGLDKTIWLIAIFIANFLVCWVPGQLLYIIASWAW